MQIEGLTSLKAIQLSRFIDLDQKGIISTVLFSWRVSTEKCLLR